MPPSAPESIGRYQVVQSIGQGGMGSIYLARDPKIGNRLVVLKVLREGFDNPEMRERFAREANAAGGLRHVNIVTIFDVGDYEGQPFIAMEYIKGTTLTDVIARKTELTMARKLQWMEELCAGLHYAHKAGVVHRDIKPANIMIDEDGLLKIVDFGIARLRSAGTGMTRTGTVMGTLNYMAPEQMAGLPVEAQADIFSFGAVFYEVLSYRKAFPGEFPSIIQKILTAQREPLATIVPDLDPALAAIVDRCLAKDPADRLADLNQVRLELAAIRQRLAVDDHLKEERKLKAWLAEAKGEVDRGALTSAALLVERALSVNSSSAEALAMRKSIDEVRRRLVDGQEKTVVLDGALQRARQQLEMGAPDAAMETVHEALKIDATNAETLLLKARVDSALTQKEKAAREAERENRARTVISEARRQFAAGDRQSALNALEGFRPQNSIVTSALAELQVEAREIERRTAAMERQRLEAEVVHLKRETEAETQRLEEEAERKKLQAEVERLKREGQEIRRKAQAPSLSSRVRAAERVGTRRGLVIGGVAAAVVALAAVGWIFWPSSSRDAAGEVGQQATAQTDAPPPAVVPQAAAVPQQAPPPSQPQLQTPTPTPAPVQTTAPPAVESRAPNSVQQGTQPATQAAPRGRNQPAQGATVATRGQAPSTQPTTSAPPAATPQPPAPQPSAPAAASDATAARNREQAQVALDTGARSEAAGDLPTALLWFNRGHDLDPSNAAANQSVTRVRDRMKKEGSDAFAKAKTFDSLQRDAQAIAQYEIAVRYLPDDDPNKQIAKTRLDALKAR